MSFSNATTVHLELTSNCQASCPQCIRNLSGDRINPLLPIRELSLSDIMQIFPHEVTQRLKHIFVCGHFGDGALATDCLEIFRYLRASNPDLYLSLHTNGSVRTPTWWKELATIIGENGEVTFGIDGLKDTHHLYRRHTVWSKIIENARAFISAGGKAVWAFIVFEHNEHQIEDCRKLSTELGFTKFVSKKTHRFSFSPNPEYANAQPVIDKNGDTLYFIRPPKTDALINRGTKEIHSLSKDELENFLDTTPIKCKTINDTVAVDFNGTVFPCGWISARMYLNVDSNPVTEILGDDYSTILNGRQGLFNVLELPFFKDFPSLWTKKMANGRPRICARVCGNIDEFGSIYEGNTNG